MSGYMCPSFCMCDSCSSTHIPISQKGSDKYYQEEFSKIQRQHEIQTKRVENLKKSNEFYADTSNWVQESSSPYPQFIGKDDSEIQDQEKIAGKLARSCQAIDQELEKQLEGL